MRARLWEYGRPYLPLYLVEFVLLLATNALSLWIPWLLREAINAARSG